MSTIDYNNGDQLASISTLLEINKTEIIGDVLKEIIKDPLYQDESGTYIWLETFKDWELTPGISCVRFRQTQLKLYRPY